MGTGQSVPRKYQRLEENFVKGMKNRKNYDIHQIFVLLIMKLQYYQTRCKLKKLPPVHEAVAYTNPIKKKLIEIPRTIDYISGININNQKNKVPCTVKIFWNGLEKTLVEMYRVQPDQSHNFCFNSLYMFLAQNGHWTVEVNEDNVSIELRCGIVDTLGQARTSRIYISSSGKAFEFVAGNLLEYIRY